jgi:hypothetical protein
LLENENFGEWNSEMHAVAKQGIQAVSLVSKGQTFPHSRLSMRSISVEIKLISHSPVFDDAGTEHFFASEVARDIRVSGSRRRPGAEYVIDASSGWRGKHTRS